jgi:hypothetical protein
VKESWFRKRRSPGWHRGGNTILNRHHKNTTVASQFGITEDALAEIEKTASSDLDRSALGIADKTVWGTPQWDSPQLTVREIRDAGRIIRIEVDDALDHRPNSANISVAQPGPENLARAIGVSLLNKFVDTAIEYTMMLTKTILAHKRTGGRAVNWRAVVDRAIEFCSHLANWENSRKWLIVSLKVGGFDEEQVTSSTQAAFLNSVSLWSTGHWKISVWTQARGFVFTQSLANPSVSLHDVLLEKIMPIVRLAPEWAIQSQPKLTERETKIAAVIHRGSKAIQYCRELENAGIRPRKIGAWKGAPGTYPAAYQAGEPWRHRIQDEKAKIKRKADSQTLAGE